ncbi:MAG: PDZ domain-containing protein [bacterium]|nr:PDZ domain-containing protein [bacterium]
MNATKPRVMVALLTLALFAGAAHAANPLLKQIEDEFVRLGEDLGKIVVNIDVEGALPDMTGEQMEGLEEFFKYFGVPVPEGHRRMPMRPPQASGSGFIYDKAGYIVTNNHVVDGAEKIEVRLWNDEVYEATAIGQDPQTDIAVIKIEPNGELPAAVFGDSTKLRVGQFAIAVGNPRRLQGSLSYGHITALGREGLRLPGLRFQDLIQTDAAINLGNSGGPLCNIDGEVIGINTAIVYGADSLGFAVPINTAHRVVPELIAEGKVTRGYLGVEIINIDSPEDAKAFGLPDEKGALVDRVADDTPAEKAGVEVYDVIRKVNGEVVENSQDLVEKISYLPPDANVTLEIWRDEEAIEVKVQLDEFPEELAVARKRTDLLGIDVAPLTPELAERLELDPDTEGVVVIDVEPGSAAADAGFGRGDVIVEVAKKPVEDVGSYRGLVKRHAKPGESLLMRVSRGGEPARIVFVEVPEKEDDSDDEGDGDDKDE